MQINESLSFSLKIKRNCLKEDPTRDTLIKNTLEMSLRFQAPNNVISIDDGVRLLLIRTFVSRCDDNDDNSRVDGCSGGGRR